MSEQVERRDLYGGDFIRALSSAWECCATCAGGVLASHDRSIKAKGWDEGYAAGVGDVRGENCGGNPYSANPPAPEASAGVGEDRSAGRWCGFCAQHGSHHSERHEDYMAARRTPPTATSDPAGTSEQEASS